MTRGASAQQSRLAALWADVRPGTPVHVRRDDGSVTVTQTRSEAWLLPSGTAVIQVVGISGCYALDRVSLRIDLAHGLFALVDCEDAELTKFRWRAERGPQHKTWYARRRLSRPARRRLFLHREVAARAGLEITGLEVDHVNCNGLDCRRANLRPATKAQNQRNKGLQSNNTSGVKGVSWDKARRKWQVHISVMGHNRKLGLFATIEAAAAAYRAAAMVDHGEFARFA